MGNGISSFSSGYAVDKLIEHKSDAHELTIRHCFRRLFCRDGGASLQNKARVYTFRYDWTRERERLRIVSLSPYSRLSLSNSVLFGRRSFGAILASAGVEGLSLEEVRRVVRRLEEGDLKSASAKAKQSLSMNASIGADEVVVVDIAAFLKAVERSVHPRYRFFEFPRCLRVVVVLKRTRSSVVDSRKSKSGYL